MIGGSGQRILRGIAAGETDPAKLRALADRRSRASDAQLKDALSGQSQPVHRNVLTLYLQRLDLIETEIAELEKMIADAMKAHEAAIVRLSELHGLEVDSAQQIIAEIGPSAAAFPSAGQLASWVGVCLGSEETASEKSRHESRDGSAFALPSIELGKPLPVEPKPA